jgi:hypothetical protein
VSALHPLFLFLPCASSRRARPWLGEATGRQVPELAGHGGSQPGPEVARIAELTQT